MTIASNPKTNPKPNPNTNRGGQFPSETILWLPPTTLKLTLTLTQTPHLTRGKLSGCRNIVNIFEKSTLKYYLGPLLQIIKSLD